MALVDGDNNGNNTSCSMVMEHQIHALVPFSARTILANFLVPGSQPL
jgi:hypothetical protein